MASLIHDIGAGLLKQQQEHEGTIRKEWMASVDQKTRMQNK